MIQTLDYAYSCLLSLQNKAEFKKCLKLSRIKRAMIDKVGELIKFVNTVNTQQPLRVKLLLQKLMLKVEQSTGITTKKDSKDWIYEIPFLEQLDGLLEMHRKQLALKSKVNNYHFIPKMRHKYNATIDWTQPSDPNVDRYPHPYRYEIQNMVYPEYIIAAPIKSKPMGPLIYVDKVSQLDSLLNELRKQSVIALDLEHHCEESYLGITCLMQLSTRNTDYIIDTIALQYDLQVLNEVFTDPKIIKVLHGANSDIIWLQRDLGLYIVHMFDTFHAAKMLGKPKQSLAVLLQEYCKYNSDKSYQRADWRQRPLSKDMLEYAQSDTHYLLEIFDNLRNEIINLKGLDECLAKSQATCLQEFFIPKYDLENGIGVGWRNSLNKYLQKHNNTSMQSVHVFKQVHYWRDNIARKVDMSPTNIIPQWQMMCIANNLPRNKQSLIRAMKLKETEVIRPFLDELVEVIEVALQSVKEMKIEEKVDIALPNPVHVVFTEASNAPNTNIMRSKSTATLSKNPKQNDLSMFLDHDTPQAEDVMSSIVTDFTVHAVGKDTVESALEEKAQIKKPAKMSMLDDIIAIDVKFPAAKPNQVEVPVLKTRIDPGTGMEVADIKKSRNNKSGNNRKSLIEDEEMDIQARDPNPMKVRNNKANPKKRKYVGKQNQGKQKHFKSK